MSGKILFICGSMNQTTMMHQISKFYKGYDCYFSPYYGDGYIDYFSRKGILDFSVLGGQFRMRTENYLRANKLQIDYKAQRNNYDLVFTCSDLIVPKNILGKKLVLVQEGMTDPENLAFYLVKYLNFPRWMASTSVTGLSDAYDYFCVASEGYRDLFISKGINEEKIRVTGIPNFDNIKKYMDNDFPYRNYVLVATSDTRETFRYENRKKFIEKAVSIAEARQIIFKLHPNENVKRAVYEINKFAPGALVFSSGNTNHMIANCDILITRFSSVVYLGIALNKEVYSEFNIEELRSLTPIQNNGTSAKNIARIGYKLLETERTKSLTLGKVI